MVRPLSWFLKCLLFASLGGLLGACGDAPKAQDDGGEGQAAASQSGSLVCREPLHDFGQAWQGAVLEHEFVLETASDAPCHVALVKADCGCTIPSLEIQRSPGAPREAYELKSPIPKDARLYVRVTYDTRDKEGPAPRNITVYGPEGALRLGLEADIRPWLGITPPLAQLGILEETASRETRYLVESLGGEVFGLQYKRSGVPEALGLELVASDPDAQGRSNRWEVRILLGPGMPRGPHTYPIRLTSDAPIQGRGLSEDLAEPPTHEIAALLQVEVVGPVSLKPAGLVFGVVQPTETVARSVRLVCHDESFSLGRPEVRLEPVEGDLEFALARTAQLSLKPVPGGSAWEIQLLLTGLDPAVKDNFLGKLVIQTGHPDLPELQALIRGVRMPMGR